MSVHVLEPEVEELVVRLTALTGETENDAILKAVQQRLDALSSSETEARLSRMRAISARIAAMPVLDDRSADEIMGYNEHGHFD